MDFGIVSDTGFDLLGEVGSLLFYSPIPLAVVGSLLLLTVGRRPPVLVSAGARLLSLAAAITCLVGSALSLALIAVSLSLGELSDIRYVGCTGLAPAVIGSIVWMVFTKGLVVAPGGISVVPHDGGQAE